MSGLTNPFNNKSENKKLKGIRRISLGGTICRYGVMVSQGIANPSTKLNWCSGSNPDGGVKDICAAIIYKTSCNICEIVDYKAGSYEVFPKSSKETSKVCLVFSRVI